jgi:predicted nucleic acid-binding protein
MARVCRTKSAKRLMRGQLSTEQAIALYEDVTTLPVSLSPGAPLIDDAYRIATTFGTSVYDALYAALAIREGCQLVTADRPLFDALAPAHAESVAWIGDLPIEPGSPAR